jgi:hypothetical protein
VLVTIQHKLKLLKIFKYRRKLTMADVKTLQTRIALKYDSYANWTNEDVENQGANLVLLKGELGICEIAATNDHTKDPNVIPTVLFKVGDGKKTFKELPWASAKAADVYSWAKASDVVLEGKTIKFVGTDKTITLEYLTETEINAKIKVVSDNLSGVDSRVTALENKFTGDGSVQGQIDALDGRLDTIEGEGDGSVKKALADAKKYTDDREVVIKAYADQAEADAISAAETASEAKVATERARITAVEGRLDAIEGADGAIADALDEAKSYADQAELDAVASAKTYTDNREAAIKTAYEAYADQAEVDAKAYADTELKKVVDAQAAADAAQNTEIGKKLDKTTYDAYIAGKSMSDEELKAYADGKASDAQSAAIAAAKTETESQISTLVTSGQVKTNTDAIAQNAADITAMDAAYKKAVAEEAKARADEDAALDARLDKVETFFEGAYTEDGQPVKEALDTLVEIQNFITGEGEAASDLIKSIEANATAIDALEKTLADGGDFDKRIDAIEADVSANAGNITTLQGDVQKAQSDATQALADALAASNKVDTKAAEIKTAYEAYADGKASAAETAAKGYADTAVAGLKTTLEAADAAIEAEVAKKLDESDFTAHTTGDHAKTATEITAEITKAVGDEKTLREAADAAIEKKIGGSYTENSTVADAIVGVKATAETAAADLVALDTRVGTAEGKITTLEGIVSTGDDSNANLRSAITELQGIVKTGADANATLGSEIDTLKAAVEHEDTGLAATKAIADEAKSDAEDAQSRVAVIERDYLKAADFFIIDCGTSVLREGEPTAQ